MGTDPSPVIKNGQIDPSIFYILGAALLHPITLSTWDVACQCQSD